MNGIAVVRAYFYLFTGARHASTISLVISTRERIAVLTLAGMILGGGFFPQPGVTTRELAAEAVLAARLKTQAAAPKVNSLDHHTNQQSSSKIIAIAVARSLPSVPGPKP